MFRRMNYLLVVFLCLAPINLVLGYNPAGDPALIAWWACDEGSGNIVGDVSGNGHDGTFVNGDPAWTNGVHGSAIELYGPTLVEVPPINMVLTEATMAGWIKPDGSQPDWSSFIMTRGTASGFNVLGYQLAYHWNDTSDSWSYRGGDMIAADDWTFAAVTVEPDKATFYVNGVAGSTNEITHTSNNWNANIYLGGDGTSGFVGRRMNGALDDVSMFSRALTEDEIKDLMSGFGDYPKASNPVPTDGSLHNDTWVTLSWRAGDFAVSHDIYLGDNFDDVSSGTGDTFRDNLPLGSEFYIAGFAGYPYPDGLVNGTTYYWRVDEVNDAEPNSPWKGDVWSFTVPPKSAYFPNPADGTEFVDLNVTLSWTAGFNAKLHYIVFGEDFDEVNNTATGTPNGTTNYSPGPLQLAKTYYWRVDEFDGFETYKGEIWSFTTAGAVSGPNPADGAVDVKPSIVLGWSAGAVAESHEVYFGTDSDAVKNATTASPEYKGPKALGEESYDPGKLTLNSTYYWRIDEVNSVNPDSPWQGNVWSFTTGDYFVIDDFEDYNSGDNQIWTSWHDGLGYGAPGTPDYFAGNGTGSAVGDEATASFTEETIVNGGSQSMPIAYDNNKQGFANYSEVELALTDQRDWTEEGVVELSLWFRGNPASVGSFVEGPVGTYTMTGSGTDIWDVGPAAGQYHDEFHFAYKTLTGPGSIIAKVESIDNTNAWAKAGVMIRETLNGDSKHAMMIVSATSGVSFQRRPDTGGASAADTTAGLSAPYWVRIERDIAGNFSAYSSADGNSWQKVGLTEPIQIATNVYIGLVVTSHDAAQTCQAVFTNVSTTGTVGAQWDHRDIGIESNEAEPLYVAVSNTSGAPAVIIYDDPAATQIDTWTEWIIPLQTFADQGIVLTDVDSIAIGIGTQGNMTTPGGKGKMYIDDVRLNQASEAAE